MVPLAILYWICLQQATVTMIGIALPLLSCVTMSVSAEKPFFILISSLHSVLSSLSSCLSFQGSLVVNNACLQSLITAPGTLTDIHMAVGGLSLKITPLFPLVLKSFLACREKYPKAENLGCLSNSKLKHTPNFTDEVKSRNQHTNKNM